VSQFVAPTLLWLFVINLGIAFGAGLYESRIVVPQWVSFSPQSGFVWNPEAARQADTGLRFWVYVTTVPLTLLTLAGLVSFRWLHEPARNWWLAAAVGALVDRAMTFGYFIPTMLNLMHNATLPESEAVETALQWARLGHMRHAAALVAWLASLRALSLLHARPG
jgi:hypothetical protein